MRKPALEFGFASTPGGLAHHSKRKGGLPAPRTPSTGNPLLRPHYFLRFSTAAACARRALKSPGFSWNSMVLLWAPISPYILT